MTYLRKLLERFSKSMGLKAVPAQSAEQPLPTDAPPPELFGALASAVD